MEPAGKIAPQPWMTRPQTAAVMGALAADGAPARFVGGCVRDALLGRPVRDIDIATAEPPDRVMALLQGAGVRAIPTGIEHGTVTAVLDREHFEVTTLRRDVETFGRRARVAFTDDWAADAARRDFTINAIFCDPDGTLYDPTGGRPDLEAGRIRFVGAALARIREDVLRLLRFFRLHAWYGTGPADEEALAACRAMAPEVATLSPERVWSELRRLLLAPDPAAVLDLMAACGVIPHVLPEAGDRSRLARLVEIEAATGAPPDAVRRLAAAIEADATGAAALAARLRLSRAETRQLALLVDPPVWPVAGLGAPHNRATLYRLGPAAFAELTLLGWASDGAGRDAAWRQVWEMRTTRLPEFPLAGGDVLALGVPAGRRVGALLATVERWWVENDFAPDRDTCLARL